MDKIPDELIQDLRKYIMENLNITEHDGDWVDTFTFRFHEPVHQAVITIKVD